MILKKKKKINERKNMFFFYILVLMTLTKMFRNKKLLYTLQNCNYILNISLSYTHTHT